MLPAASLPALLSGRLLLPLAYGFNQFSRVGRHRQRGSKASIIRSFMHLAPLRLRAPAPALSGHPLGSRPHIVGVPLPGKPWGHRFAGNVLAGLWGQAAAAPLAAATGADCKPWRRLPPFSPSPPNPPPPILGPRGFAFHYGSKQPAAGSQQALGSASRVSP